MRYFLLMTLIMSVCEICVAEEQNLIGFYEENGQKKALNLSAIIDVITKKNDLSNLTLNPMPSPLNKKKAPITKKYARTLMRAVKSLLPENKSDIADEKACNKLILLRNKLLEAGGYSNICLAGSITGIINAFHLNKLIKGKTIKPKMIKKNKLDLKDIMNVIKAADEMEFKTSILSKLNINNGTEIEQLRILLGNENKPQKGPVKLGDWIMKAGKTTILFSGHWLNLKQNNPISYLFNWCRLLDEQKAIKIINSIALNDPTFLLSDDNAMKDKIRKYLAVNDCGIMITQLEPWPARRVFDVFRKFRGGTIPKYGSPYATELSFYLKYYE